MVSAASVALLLAAVVALTGRTSGPLLSHADDSYEARNGLRCANPTQDFGETEDSRLHHVFLLENTTDNVITIESVGKSCGCLNLSLSSSVLKPKSTTELEVTAQASSDRHGEAVRFAHEIHVHGRDSRGEDASIALAITGVYVPPAYMLGSQLVIRAPDRVGDRFGGTFDVYVNRDRNVDIGRIECSGELSCEASVANRARVEGTPFERITIRVTGKFAEGALPRMGDVTLLTTSDAAPRIRRNVVLVSPAGQRLRPEPSSFAFGVLGAGARSVKKLRFSSSDSHPFSIARLHCSREYLSVTAIPERGPGDTLEITCVLDSRGISGPIDATVVAEIDREGRRETYTIPASGFIRKSKAK